MRIGDVSNVRLATVGGMLLALVAGDFLPANAQTPAQQPVPRREVAKAPVPAQIDRNGVLILVRSAIVALQQANQTGNYTVLRDLGAPAFQQANTAARLAEIFANLRGRNLDLTGVVVLEPQLTLLPQIEANGMMRLAGSFPSVPLQVNFEMMFAPEGGKWRLFGISVNLGDSAPAAPQPMAQTEPAKTEIPKTEPAKTGLAKPGAAPSSAPQKPASGALPAPTR